MPSSSSAASTWLTCDRSDLMRWLWKIASACVNHCCGEWRQNPGSRTDANALMSKGIVVDGSVGARGHGKSPVLVLAPTMSEFALETFVFVLSELALVVLSDQTSPQSCITRGGKRREKKKLYRCRSNKKFEVTNLVSSILIPIK
jgi:hypothetical protein